MEEKILEISSTTTPDECKFIWELASKLPECSVVVEIGTGGGCVTAVLASAIAGKGSILYTVDNYTLPEKYGMYEWTSEKVKESLDKLNLSGHVRLIIGNSLDVAKEFESMPQVDMVFLDAGHSYQDVCNDIDAWYPRIKPGGIIAGHDWDPHCSDGRNVIKAICDKLLINPDRPMTVRDRVWWMEIL